MKEVFYKAKEDFVHRKVAESDVLISVGANVANFNGSITLNPTASLLWDALATPQTVDTLTKMLTAEFDVSDEVAKTDVENFLEMLKRNSMVTVYEDT